MNIFQTFLLIGVIVAVVCICKQQEKTEYNNKVKEIADFKIDCAKNGNRRLLEQYGVERFILLYGEDQYNSIKNNTDTKLVEPIAGWEDRLRKEYNTYVC